MRGRAQPAGFTLIEVLIALAVTAFVAAAAYAGLDSALAAIERSRASAERVQAVNLAFATLNRDLRQFVPRPVRDEFGVAQPALSGGRLARFPLTLTRTGWHNTAGLPRSHLERVSYLLDAEGLWRLSWPQLDRGTGTPPLRVQLLDEVLALELRFLPTTAGLALGSRTEVDTRRWPESWVADSSQPGSLPEPPAALELSLELADLGWVSRLYVLPPL